MNATIFEAKTRFSELVSRAVAGEEVIITSGRGKKPVARLEALHPRPMQRLGSMAKPGWRLGEAFWEPLPEGWDGAEE